MLDRLERRLLWAAGDLDASFGVGGLVRDNVASYAGSPDAVTDVAAAPDGKIVALGSISDGPEYGSVLRRYLSNGAVDTSFGGGDGKVHVGDEEWDDPYYAVAVQADGKIIAVGEYTYRDADPSVPFVHHDFGVWRFNADGSIDTTFGGGDGLASAAFDDFSEAHKVEIAPDGKIVVMGYTKETMDGQSTIPSNWADDGTGWSTAQLAVARFNADGSPDTTFSGDGKLTHKFDALGTFADDLAIQADGKIIVTGSGVQYTPRSFSQPYVMRLNSNGSLDSSFSGNGIFLGDGGDFPENGSFRSAEIDSHGKAVVLGGDKDGFFLARFNTNGTLDLSFGDSGVARILEADVIGDLALDSNDNFLVTTSNIGVARFTPRGDLDTTFGTAGVASVNAAFNGARAQALEVQADEKILLGLSGDNTPALDFVIARFHGGEGDDNPSTPPQVVIPDTVGSEEWSRIIDYGEREIFVTAPNGEQVEVPRPAADGSVNIAGTEDPDTVTVERVEDLLPYSSGDVLHQRVYFTTPDGVVGLSFDYATYPTEFYPLVAGHESVLAEAKSVLAQATAQGVSDSQLAKAQHNVDVAQAALDRIYAVRDARDAATGYIRYRMDGLWEIFVADTGQLTAQSRIRIDAAGGNDVVAISTNVPMKSTLAGGWGADKLTSGRRRSLLLGGGGSDRLFSRSTVGATLDGGKGADRYWNRCGEVEIMARCDGDCLVIDDKSVSIETAGLFGISSDPATPGKCYYLMQTEEGEVDLLSL